MSAARVYLDGQFLDESAAAVPVSDRGFLYGDAVFETLRTWRGVPFLLDRHLARLFASCEELGIQPREDAGELAGVVARLAGEVGGECYLRVVVTRGSGYGPWPRELPERGRTAVVARPLQEPPAELYARGLRLVTSPMLRHEASPLSAHKTANYLESVLARGEAAERGADEALVLNYHGRVAELAAANVFAVIYGRLITPAAEEGPLPGVTRGKVLELAAQLELPTHKGKLAPEALADADEAFATSSLLGLCPIAELDGGRIGGEVPGPITARLQEAYRQEVARACAASAR